MVYIATDNGSDITMAEGQDLGIHVFPLTIRKESKEYLLEEDISIDQLYENLKAGDSYTTSQGNAYRYKEVFEEYAKEGKTLLYITLSSNLSGTYGTAKVIADQLNKEYPEGRIYIYDSKSATGGQRVMALKAMKMADSGYTVGEIIEALDHIKENQQLLFTVGDLDHLYKGGRLSRASKIIGGFLDICPIMDIDTRVGSIQVTDTVRGSRGIFKKFKKEVEKRVGDLQDQDIYLMLGDWPKMEKMSEDFLVDELGVDPSRIKRSKVSGIIAAHTGPEAMAIMLYKDPEPYKNLNI